MANYLLDTNVLIDLAGTRQSASYFEKILDTESTRLATSMLCLAEYFSGSSPKETKFLESWLNSGELMTYPLENLETVKQAGAWRQALKVPLPDALIVATAKHHDCILITLDTDLIKWSQKQIRIKNPLVL